MFVNVKIKEDWYSAYIICCDNADSVWNAFFLEYKSEDLKRISVFLFELNEHKYIKLWLFWIFDNR